VALNAIPAEFREALLLVDAQELNYQEAAGVLGVPLGTIKSRVSRGRALMREALSHLHRVRVKTGS
jgi:RNA polymerase sigma-70 factor (ECF subfamily)